VKSRNHNRLILGYVGTLGKVIGGSNGDVRAAVDPVAAADDNRVASHIVTAETEVVGGEGSVRIEEVPVVACDVGVVADLVATVASQVVAESSKAGMELFKDNGLSLDLTDLLGDDSLGHFLEDNQALLDDLDLLGVAHEFVVLLNDYLVVVRTREVVGSIKVIEVIEGGHASPVVERRPISPLVDAGVPTVHGGCGNAGSQKRDGDERSGEFSEHCE